MRQSGSAFATLGPAIRNAKLKGKGAPKASGTPAIPKTAGKPNSNVLATKPPDSGGTPSTSLRLGDNWVLPNSSPPCNAPRVIDNWVLPTRNPPPLATDTSSSSRSTTAPTATDDSSRAAPPEKDRNDFPHISEQNVKMPRADIVKAVANQDIKDDLLKKFDADVRAASSTATAVSTWNTWCKFHHAWFGDDSAPVPLDPIKIRAVGACFKEGAYRSFAPYLSKAKEEHILAGYLWSDLLDLSGRRANRSVTRGVGVSRQPKPFELDKALVAATTPGFTPAKDTPIGWKSLLVIATFFVLR